MTAAIPSTSRSGPRPGRRREIVVDGASTPWWSHGDGGATGGGHPEIVALHGFRGDHHGLEQIVAGLRGRRVAVPDLPGFGEAPPLRTGAHDLDGYAAWAASFVRAVAPGGAVLLGHSFGSIVAAAAVAGGLPVRALVLVNPIPEPALPASGGGLSMRATLTRGTVLLHRFAGAVPERAGTALLRSRLFTRVASVAMVKTPDRALRRWIHAEHDRFFGGFADRRVLLEAFGASIAHGVGAFAPRITVPTLLVAAELDDLATVVQQRRLAELFPDASLEVVPGTGHLAHYETPGVVAEHVEAFLARLP